ncbi:MAG TPA: hypothetical protein DCE44_00060, partial [Verrucomicrobiales bacterium]|nr:hypothetical protein [Verrucomicrobiales bacterium]
MKAPNWLEGTAVAAELRPTSFHARSGDDGVDLPVERSADGRITAESAASILTAVKNLVGGKSWLSRVKITCAIGSRGLILRPLTIPAAPSAEVPRLLQLQIESEFPLPPEALAWGWIPLPTASTPGRQDVLVAAVKKEVVEELTALFKPIAADLVITPATLARVALVPADAPAFAIVDVAPTQCELTLREIEAAPSVRLLPWGENRLDDVTAAPFEGINRLVELLPMAALKLPLWISGSATAASKVAQLLQPGREGNLPPVRALEVPTGPGRTAAIEGIIRSQSANEA